jgi:hypothetical protein
MNDKTRVLRRPPRAWPPVAQTAAAIVATAALALPAAAYAGSSRSPATAPGSAQSAVAAFSRCMRSHGVPKFPGATSSGVIPTVSLPKLGVSSSKYLAAQDACAVQAKQAYAFVVARCIPEHTKSSTADKTCEEYGKHALGGLPS